MTTPEFTFQSLAGLTGQRIGSSSWITLDQARIDEFAHCTNDTQWQAEDKPALVAHSMALLMA